MNKIITCFAILNIFILIGKNAYASNDEITKNFIYKNIYSACIEAAINHGKTIGNGYSDYCKCYAEKESEEFSLEEIMEVDDSPYLKEKEKSILDECSKKYLLEIAKEWK